MRRPDLRIRVQLTVSVCLFTLICLVSLAAAIYTMSRHTLLRLEKGNLDLTSRILREECNQEFEELFDTLFRVSYSSPVKRIFDNYTDEDTIVDAANLLHDSFGPDRILLMKLYLPNGTEIVEVDSRQFRNRSGIPNSLLPLTYTNNVSNLLTSLHEGNGQFYGPSMAGLPIAGTRYLMSLTLPIRQGQRLIDAQRNTNAKKDSETTGYATFLINCLKVQNILSSVSLSSAASEVSNAALCSASNDLSTFKQLIPFSDNTTLTDLSSLTMGKFPSDKDGEVHESCYSTADFPIPKKMSQSLRQSIQPSAQVNQGPEKSMISISEFSILDSSYYIVVLQSHKGVFSMTSHLRNIIVIASCVIGASMILFTFLFVSFGARQILRLKMAATYEQPAPSRWKILPLPWWLSPVNRKREPDPNEKSEFRVPEQVPLRKHVRDELDDITERFNLMSSELRKQYALLEDRVEARKTEIEQAREAADIANAAKSHFLARVTHELRTPLNGIIGTATLCLEEDDIQQIHQSLRTIFKCGELLLHLMTDLLSFSQNEVENLNLELRDFSLGEITSQLTAIFTEQCAGKHIKLVVDSDPKNDEYVFSGDTNRILQVIFNLMSNGIKFTPEGGEVRFKAEVDDDKEDASQKVLTCYVKDNGPGIAPEMQARVFEAFVQGDISSHVKKAGVGLGLSICRQLAERMSGTVFLKSELGKGSTFIFRIPLHYRLNDSDDGSGSGQELLDVGSSASIIKKSQSGNGSTMYSSSLGSPVNEPNESLDKSSESEERLSPLNQQPQGGSKIVKVPENDDKAATSSISSTARSMLNRTLSSTSLRPIGFLSPRRKTQESIFRPVDFLKRRASSIDKENSAKLKTPVSSSSTVRPSREDTPVDSVPALPTFPSTKAETASVHKLEDSPVSQHKSSPTPSSSSAHIAKSAKNFPSLPLITTSAFSERGDSMSPTSAASVLPDAHNAGPDQLEVKTGFTSSKPWPEQPPPNIKVLVVDDNLVNQEVMMRMLNLEGLQSISVANDGLDALEKIRQADAERRSFDVIFMDVQMPNMDGRQATRVIRNEMEKTVPIVAVSAFANEKNADDCIEAGMNLFLSKPLRRPHLREILRSLASITAKPDAKK